MARFELDSAELSTIGGRALSPEVFFELGMMYSCGRDVEVNLVSAHKWFNLAAMSGSEEAKEYRTEIALEMYGWPDLICRVIRASEACVGAWCAAAYDKLCLSSSSSNQRVSALSSRACRPANAFEYFSNVAGSRL